MALAGCSLWQFGLRIGMRLTPPGMPEGNGGEPRMLRGSQLPRDRVPGSLKDSDQGPRSWVNFHKQKWHKHARVC
ncbi:hypothetical protein MRX96_039994 [Rhipicephalus microplus]